MRYVSTRGQAPAVEFRTAVMTGLAPDRGLYVPEYLPDVSAELARWRPYSYRELAFEVIRRFADVDESRLWSWIDRAYSTFRHPDIVPVVPVGDLWILELFHGPTLAFKDLALQLVGRLLHAFLEESGQTLNIIVATSGDTGSAAIQGVRGSPRIRIFVLFPHGRISPLQERQMTCVIDPQVFNLAVDGTFDDCQRIVKTLLADRELRQEVPLGALNSVNWARVLAQMVYYFAAFFAVSRQTGGDRVQFVVPTGNFGNVFAGYVAARMGLPVDRLIVATNENDILYRFFETGEYRVGSVVPTLSPSMDIQVASNFERYVYYRLGGDTGRVRAIFDEFERTGGACIPEVAGDPLWAAGKADTERTLATIRQVWQDHGYLLDPHSAVGVAVARERAAKGAPVVCLATAHPAKFPDAVRRAVGRDVAHHPALERLKDAPTRVTRISADVVQVREFIRQHALRDDI